MIWIEKKKGTIKMFNFGFMLSAAQSGGCTGGFGTIGMLLVFVVVLYFFMIRPQGKKRKEEEAMRDSLAVGDEVTTIGGIIGKVVSIKGETFVLETTKDKTKIRFLKGAIRSIDVKVADVASQVLESVPVEAAPSEEKPAKKGLFGRKSKKKAEEAPAEVAAPEVEAPAEESESK